MSETERRRYVREQCAECGEPFEDGDLLVCPRGKWMHGECVGAADPAGVPWGRIAQEGE